jgi:uncharacterized protein YigA (DUF484 family)
MQIDLPLDGGTLFGLASFAVAVVFQSAMLKRNVEIITTRISKIEDDMAKITQLLVSNEGLTQRLNALSDRMRHIEEVATNLHATNAAGRRAPRKAAGDYG